MGEAHTPCPTAHPRRDTGTGGRTGMNQSGPWLAHSPTLGKLLTFTAVSSTLYAAPDTAQRFGSDLLNL